MYSSLWKSSENGNISEQNWELSILAHPLVLIYGCYSPSKVVYIWNNIYLWSLTIVPTKKKLGWVCVLPFVLDGNLQYWEHVDKSKLRSRVIILRSSFSTSPFRSMTDLRNLLMNNSRIPLVRYGLLLPNYGDFLSN